MRTEHTARPKSMAIDSTVAGNAGDKNYLSSTVSTHARAIYSYLSSGENQLSFHEGDLIALIGPANKGWQYGENLRSHRSGWFPAAYIVPPNGVVNNHQGDR